jgi:hypothetical protein
VSKAIFARPFDFPFSEAVFEVGILKVLHFLKIQLLGLLVVGFEGNIPFLHTLSNANLVLVFELFK